MQSVPIYFSVCIISCSSVWNRCDLFISVICVLFIYTARYEAWTLFYSILVRTIYNK
jgi:hypothetical protein